MITNSLELKSTDKISWDKFKAIIKNDKFAQSMLFVGSELDIFVHRLIALKLCRSPQFFEPCLQCSDCLMVMQDEHPDISYIKPEKSGSAIKIEQIRFLQTEIYQSLQRGKNGFIIIKTAESMNRASANALLKILEEPPANKHFILIAAHLATLPATILSRCQLWRINSANSDDFWHLLANSEPQERIAKDLLSLAKGETIPSILAASWKDIPLKELCILLYRINAKILVISEFNEANSSDYPLIKEIANHITPKKIFQQIDKINALQNKLSHNIHINSMLAIEDLLMDWG